VAGNIQGQGGLTVVGGHVLLLAANNFHTGGTIVRDNSTVLITTDRNLGAAAGRLTLDGGTLWTQGPIGSSRPITLDALGGTFTTDTFNVILDGPFDGAGALIKRGLSTLSLYGISTRTGSLRVAAGRLRIGHESLLWPTAPVAVDAASVLDLLDVQPTIGSLTGPLPMNGGALSPNGSDAARLIVNGDAAFNADGTFVVNGEWRNTRSGAGTWFRLRRGTRSDCRERKRRVAGGDAASECERHPAV
jgi:fibronectin-binding autotransporter adhesin